MNAIPAKTTCNLCLHVQICQHYYISLFGKGFAKIRLKHLIVYRPMKEVDVVVILMSHQPYTLPFFCLQYLSTHLCLCIEALKTLRGFNGELPSGQCACVCVVIREIPQSLLVDRCVAGLSA